MNKIPTVGDMWKENLKITAVEALPGYVLRLSYGDGEVYLVDMSDFVGTGNLTDDLVDLGMFAAVKVGGDGDWIEWPNGIDIGSDTLRWDGELARRGLTRADVNDVALDQ